jgi:hypothetical protein
MKLYVYAASKKALNERLAQGQSVVGTNHSFFGDGGDYALDAKLPTDTVIAVYSKNSAGTPVAKSWGLWDAQKLRVK